MPESTSLKRNTDNEVLPQGYSTELADWKEVIVDDEGKQYVRDTEALAKLTEMDNKLQTLEGTVDSDGNHKVSINSNIEEIISESYGSIDPLVVTEGSSVDITTEEKRKFTKLNGHIRFVDSGLIGIIARHVTEGSFADNNQDSEISSNNNFEIELIGNEWRIQIANRDTSDIKIRTLKIVGQY